MLPEELRYRPAVQAAHTDKPTLVPNLHFFFRALVCVCCCWFVIVRKNNEFALNGRKEGSGGKRNEEHRGAKVSISIRNELSE